MFIFLGIMMSFIQCSRGGCWVATDLVYQVLAFICELPRYMYLGYSKYSLFTLRNVPCVSWGYINKNDTKMSDQKHFCMEL